MTNTSLSILLSLLLSLAVSAEALTQGAEAGQVAERVAAAISVPAAAREARAAGLPARELSAALDAFRARSVPANEVHAVIQAATAAAASNGPIDNFGAFVRSRLDQGMRGRELAAAIRAEPARRGRGGEPSQDTATSKRGRRAGGEKQRIP